MRSFKKLLLFTNIPGAGGNCKILEATSILSISSSIKSNKTATTIDVSILRKYNLQPEDFIAEDEYDILPSNLGINILIDNIVSYIAGYAVIMIKRKIKCGECLLGCYLDVDDIPEVDRKYSLLFKKNRGNNFFKLEID